MDDITIINQLREDPSIGLYSLISQYRNLVAKVSSSLLTGHNEDIEEVIADTFINVWKSIDRLDPERGSLKGLLITTARHNAINRWHQLKNSYADVTEDCELFLANDDTLNILVQEEDNEALQELINTLVEPDREIFVRRHYYLEPVKNISVAIGLSEKQISNRLYQCKLRLREQLSERGLQR